MDVAALLQEPPTGMAVEGALCEHNTNGFIDLSHAVDQRAPPNNASNGIVQLTIDLQAAVDEMWTNRFGSRYKHVKVLLVSWEADDLGVVKEVQALEHVLVEFYQYEVSTYMIPSYHSDRLLTRRVIEFVDSASKGTLLIFYYGGHASLNPHRQESIIWSANRQRNSPALTANAIQSMFEAADCDVLLIYDSCHSADTAIASASISRGATELMAACGFEGIAAEVGEHSFTNALIEVLVMSSTEALFSVSQLHTRVIQQLKKWNPSPTRDGEGKFVRDRYGQLVMEPQRRRTPVYCNLTHDGNRKPILLSSISQSPGGRSGCNFFVQPGTMAMASNLASTANENTALSSNIVASRSDMVISVKLVDDVAAGKQDPIFDAWLEWLRSAPRQADRIGINVAESFSFEVEDHRGEDLPAHLPPQVHQTELSSYSAAALNAGTAHFKQTRDKRTHSSQATQLLYSTLNLGASVPSLPLDVGKDASGLCSSPWIQLPPSASHRRGPWSKAEDEYLARLVNTQGALNWVRIAQLVGGRSPKQCRERYHQNLKPSLNHEPISAEEGLKIEILVGEMGKRWAEIARRLHGRSENAVKTWWCASMNRRRKVVFRRTDD